MTREEVIQLLKDELKVKVSVNVSNSVDDYGDDQKKVKVIVSLLLGDDEICESKDYDAG